MKHPEVLDDTFSGFHLVESKPENGFYFDFLGCKTRLSFFNEDLSWLSGRVFGFPRRDACLFFEFEEWQGAMNAVREAKESFTCIELGCGWGPWMVACLRAARQRGIHRISLTGVEADAGEIEKLDTHFSDNGLDKNDHTIIHAAVDDRDAFASESNPGGARLLSIETLLSNFEFVDVIHCDIQFAEARALAAGFTALSSKVKRLIVGTHSRKIEDDLINTFQDNGWAIEFETPCKYFVNSGRLNLLADGAQVWRNLRL